MLISLQFITLLVFVSASCFCIFVDKPLNAILCLLSLFFVTCVYLFILELEFLGIIYLMIHIGAIIVLFLFVTLCFSGAADTLAPMPEFRGSLAVDSGLIFAANTLSVISDLSVVVMHMDNSYLNYFHFLQFQVQDIQVFGVLLYTQFCLYLLVLGVILLIVMLGVIMITLDSTVYKQQADYRDRNLVSILLVR